MRRGTVPLAVLDYRLHYLDTLAVYNNQLVLQNGLYHDVAGRGSSPYIERLLTLAAPLVQSVNQRAQFQVAPAFLLGNRGRVVSSLLVDFDNGAAPATCLPGQLVNVSYPTPGAKVLRFTVSFTNGTSAQSRASLTVLRQPPASRSIFHLNDIEARDAFQDYNSSRSLYGKGEVLVVLNNTASETDKANGLPYLRNPVVVLDGFDPNDESLLDVDTRAGKSILTQLDETGISALLTALHRDLVILNFPKSQRRQVSGGMTSENIDGGTDYVERNAYVLETLLNTLKPLTYRAPGTSQPDNFALIGPSMAGLISRYALAHMEKQQLLLADAGSPADPWWDHNTAEWISFDTPHMGANIPLGDQCLLAFFNDNQAARDNLEQRLDAVAAKQFLVAHHTYAGPNVGGAPDYRDRFMLALRDNGERGSYGYPVHLRRVALANGKLNGLLPPGGEGTPCGKIFDLNIYTRFLPGVGAAIISFLGLSYKTTSPTTIATSTIRFLPEANTSCPIFFGITNETHGLSWGRIGPTAIRFKSVTGGTQGSWDLAPGGRRNTQQGLHDQFEAAGTGEHFKVSVTDLHPSHCFIPTVSALGFQYQSTSTYQNTSSLPNPFVNLLIRGDLVCNNEIPFDDFYAPATANTGHVTVPDIAARNFLIQELTPQVARPALLTAPASICPGGSETYVVAPVCARAGQLAITYAWSTPDPAITIIPGTPGRARIDSQIGFAGYVTVTVMASRVGWLSNSISFRIYIGIPFEGTYSTFSTTGPSGSTGQTLVPASTGLVNTVREDGVTITFLQEQGVTYIFNQVPSANISYFHEYDYDADMTIASPNVVVSVNVTKTNSCGSQTNRYDFMQDPTYQFRSSPNPANEAVTVEAVQPAAAGSSTRTVATGAAFEVTLYDNYGRLVSTQRSANGRARLDVRGLPAGLYNLRAGRGNNVHSEHLHIIH